MQNGANSAPNNNEVEVDNSTRASNNETTTLKPSYTDNELVKASLNTLGRRDYANRHNNSGLLLEKEKTCGNSNSRSKNYNNTNDTFKVEKIEQKQNDFGEKFVERHVIDKDCCRCRSLLVQDSNNKNNNNNKLKNKQEDSLYLSGVNSRCNCSGRRRSTLSGLIELFEQKLRLEEPAGCGLSKFKSSSSSSFKPSLSARERLIQRDSFRKNKRIEKSQQVNRVCSRKVLRRQNKQSKMRDIITPVKYEATTTTSGSNSSTETDSIEFEFVQKQKTARERSHDDQHATESRNKSLHHAAVKGVPVYPGPSVEKLTKTRWQPPTDGRKYERRYATPSAHIRSSSTNSNSDFRLSKATTEQRRINDDQELEGCNYTSDSSSYQSLAHQQIESPNSVVNARHTGGVSNNRYPKVSRSISATLAATRGPPIVKHQTSSSRRLLNQLAKLRRLNEPFYRIKRPEKVAEVEKLIERLERATQEWDDDEYLLDRAERRDWPPEYHKRFSNNYQQRLESKEKGSNRLGDKTVKEQDIEDFGCRLDVNPLEHDTIARSHYNYNMAGATNFTQTGSYSANSTLPITKNEVSRRSRAFVDRYLDDLAVRRLSCGKLSSSHSNSATSSQMHTFNRPQMSYLLCSNAYTPSIDTNVYSAYETLDQRVRNDDLHYRNVKNKPESFEPPFGIPRQLTVAASHSSASHYLRRQENTKAPMTRTNACTCICNSGNNNNGINDINEECCRHIATKRPDSKVSFNDVVDRASGSASVDSGVAPGSPYSPGRQSSATSRLTPVSSPLVGTDNSLISRRAHAKSPHRETPIEQYVYEDDVTQEVDLDEELAKGRRRFGQSETDLQHNLSICESPILERYKTEIIATPIRRRPRINIENPRSKSPLLRIANNEIKSSEQEARSSNNNVDHEQQPKVEIQCYDDNKREKTLTRRPICELECKYDFQDEDDEEDKELIEKQSKRVVSTNYDTDDSSLVDEISSDIHLDHKGEQSRINHLDTQPKQQPDKSGPSFSIGEYTPLNKANLKIL